jgi:hypothetical protein
MTFLFFILFSLSQFANPIFLAAFSLELHSQTFDIFDIASVMTESTTRFYPSSSFSAASSTTMDVSSGSIDRVLSTLNGTFDHQCSSLTSLTVRGPSLEALLSRWTSPSASANVTLETILHRRLSVRLGRHTSGAEAVVQCEEGMYAFVHAAIRRRLAPSVAKFVPSALDVANSWRTSLKQLQKDAQSCRAQLWTALDRFTQLLKELERKGNACNWMTVLADAETLLHQLLQLYVVWREKTPHLLPLMPNE